METPKNRKYFLVGVYDPREAIDLFASVTDSEFLYSEELSNGHTISVMRSPHMDMFSLEKFYVTYSKGKGKSVKILKGFSACDPFEVVSHAMAFIKGGANFTEQDLYEVEKKIMEVSNG